MPLDFAGTAYRRIVMNLIVLAGAISSILVIIIALLSKKSKRNKRIEEVRNRAAQRQLAPKIIEEPNMSNIKRIEAEVAQEKVISALLSNNPTHGGGSEFIELWATTDQDNLKG